MKKEQKKLLELIKQSKSILIVSHEYPDEDCVGSMIAMYWILKKLGKKNIKLVSETNYKLNIKFLKGLENIIIDKIERHSENVDLIIIVDTNRLGRIAGFPETILREKKVVIIDHHEGETNIKYDIYINKISSSTCQVIYELFRELIKNDSAILKPLLLGIYADTGGFQYAIYKNTFKIVEEIIHKGIKFQEIVEDMNTIDKKIFEGGMLIFNNVKFDDNKKYFFTYITRNEARRLCLDYAEITSIKDNFFNELLKIKGYNFGFLVKPKPDKTCSITFRSRTINVRQIATRFGGGGHEKAAGANLEIYDSIEAVNYVRNKLKKIL